MNLFKKLFFCKIILNVVEVKKFTNILFETKGCKDTSLRVKLLAIIKTNPFIKGWKNNCLILLLKLEEKY